MTVGSRDAVHTDPVWRDRADFVIGAELAGEERAEQLWAKRLGEKRFEVCCIPFFLYDVALGDVVSTDSEFNVTGVAIPSGRYVFRVWFGGSLDLRDEVTSRLAEIGAQMEWSSPRLLAVDAADDSHAQQVAAYLAQQERDGRLTFEAGRL